MKGKQKGITLIALVITIIVLIILAGVSINLLVGEDGLIKKAREASEETKNAEEDEKSRLNALDNLMNETIGGGTMLVPLPTQITTENVTAVDDKGNTVVVPEGFKVVISEGTTVDKGIVIEDESGNQFVWIPVGKITKADGTKETIELNRYTFGADGTPTAQNDAVINTYFRELTSSSYGNTVAKDIEGFKTSTVVNKGYYIGRYEARTATKRTAAGNALTPITSKKSDYVYNYITQPQAATQARNMYNKSTFTSDLINSYAWDTAIVFIQKCGENANYANQNSLNASTLAEKGTDNDKQCNIYDIASNILEWTTETCNYSNNPCGSRGGYYLYSTLISSNRDFSNTAYGSDYRGFRTILYL